MKGDPDILMTFARKKGIKLGLQPKIHPKMGKEGKRCSYKSGNKESFEKKNPKWLIHKTGKMIVVLIPSR